MPPLTLGLAGILAYAVVSLALRGYPFARALVGNGVLLACSLIVIAAVLRRRRHWAGCERLFWDTLALGMALWSVGLVGFAWDELVRRSPTWLAWHTIFSLCGGIAPLIALQAIPHRGPRQQVVTVVRLDMAAAGLLAVFVYCYFVLVPSLLPAARSEAQADLLTLIGLNRFLLLSATLSALWFARATPWRATYLRLVAGIAIGFILRIGANLAITRGEYQTGSLHDLAWIIPWLSYAWAAIEAPESEHEDVGLPGKASPVVLSAVPVLLIPAIGYGVLQIEPVGAPIDSFRALLTSVTTVCGLALLTLRLAAQSGQLHRADARLRLLAAATEQTADLILITRADGSFEHANSAFVQALGYTRRDLATRGFVDLLAPESVAPGRQIPPEVRARGIWRGTLVRRRRDGSTFPAACTVVGLKDSAGRITHFVGVERDMSEELRLRDQLVHSERMSAIGALVAGVAHEINNPLQAIIGSAELMLDEQPGTIKREDLEVVRREAARAGQIVRNLLSFIRRGASERTPEDLNQIVRATTELREYHLQQMNIELQLRCASGILPVVVNRDEIQQVALNLLLNAEHAISSTSGVGTISVETFRDGDRCVVEVADTGPGVPPDLRGRIFEPFFTTKDVGEGTGLGLSISHGVAAAHGGALELRESSSGARFRLSLPVHAAATAAAPLKPASAGQRVLVVDDESGIRGLLARLLERRGFEVLEADTAEAAMAAVGAERLDLVLCDVLMPGDSGLRLYRRMVAANPALRGRFLLVSGDITPLGDSDDPELGEVPFLGKPFTAADLDAALARMGLAPPRPPS